VATTPVGKRPQTIAVDEATNTVYVANRDSNTVSVINGAVCNATNTLGCSGGHWRTVSVGDSPLGLALNPANHTLYVTNSHDDSVSVINASTCNGTTTSGCNQRPPTISVGSFPAWGIGVDPGTNTVFAGNLNDLTVSVINGATCNGTNRSGCGQVPPAVIVGAFPSTAGNGSHILAQTVLVDPATHKVYIPTLGDGDVAVIDGSVCTGSNTSHCQASIVSLRMGGHVAIAGLDDSSGTVYVSNNADGTVSLFAK